LVRFCGAYHGWWDGVQPGVGNQRKTNDVYTLSELSEKTLHVLDTRDDIACVLVNPLQAMHPNSDAPGDVKLVSSERSACFDKATYAKWLKQVREVCRRRDIVLIFDEVFTGFRLGYHGAQDYFGIQADMVTYGKTLGGGLPIGALCGKRELMKRYKDDSPANISFARGTFNSHPYVMASMNEFLNRVEMPEYQAIYDKADDLWNQRVSSLNQQLQQASLPVKLVNMHSIITVLYELPSRYNWMLQFYLKAEGLEISWVGTGRFIMSLNYTDDDFQQVCQCFIRAAEKMKADGWWWQSPELTNKAIKRSLLKEMLVTRFPILEKPLKVSSNSDFNQSNELEKA
jgi:glutamate-1-semialdehyde 2,1-aminomutase